MIRYIRYILFLIVILSCCACQDSTTGDPDDIQYIPLAFTPPDAPRVEIENGIKLYLLEDHELPLVTLSAVVRMGSFYDPPGKEGLAKLTGSVMRTGGTLSMTGDQIDESLDLMAGIISVSVDTESCTISMSVLQEDLDRGMKLFSDIMMNPAFAQEKIDLSKAIETEELRRIYDNPQDTAFREFRRLIYRGDPRGRLSSVDSIKKIEREDLLRFHKRFFRPSNLMISVSGDVQANDMIEKIQRYMGPWRSSEENIPIPPPPVYQASSMDYIFKDTPQAIILVGQPAPGKDSPDYYAFEVLDFIIGSGGFRSRIFNEVRNRLGLAYSAGSFYSTRTGYGIFGAYAMAKASSATEVLTTMTNILKEIREAGVTPEELSWAKESIINNFIFSVETPNRIVVSQMMLEHDGLPHNFLTSYKNNIEKVGLNDLREVASRFLSEENRVVLVLGDEKRFENPLSSFGAFQTINDYAVDSQ